MEYQIEQIEANSNQEITVMTTVIAIKCPEDIVLARDSLASSPMAKNSQVSKIFKTNNSIGIGTAVTDINSVSLCFGFYMFYIRILIRFQNNNSIPYLSIVQALKSSINCNVS